MDEKITPSKRAIALLLVIGVTIGFSFLFYNFYLKELTWKQTVRDYVNSKMSWEKGVVQVRDRIGTVVGYTELSHAGELIFLLTESGFEAYGVKAFALKGFCVIELDENVYTLSNKLKLRIFNECLVPVNYVKVIASDGNYFIEPVTGEYAPMPLARGERKAIVVKDEEV